MHEIAWGLVALALLFGLIAGPATEPATMNEDTLGPSTLSALEELNQLLAKPIDWDWALAELDAGRDPGIEYRVCTTSVGNCEFTCVDGWGFEVMAIGEFDSKVEGHCDDDADAECSAVSSVTGTDSYMCREASANAADETSLQGECTFSGSGTGICGVINSDVTLAPFQPASTHRVNEILSQLGL